MFNYSPTLPKMYTPNDIYRKTEKMLIDSLEMNKEFVKLAAKVYNDSTDNHFTTYTDKVIGINENVVEYAKKIIKSQQTKASTGNSKQD